MDTGTRSQDEYRTDNGLLHLGPATFTPVQQQRTSQSRGKGGHLDRPVAGLPVKGMRGYHAESRDLRNGEIDEDDTARQHPAAERDMRG